MLLTFRLIFLILTLTTSISVSASSNDENINTNDLIKQHLEISAFRHKVLSENIANVNTPGYKAKEVITPKNLKEFKQNKHKKVKLAVTSPKHIAGNKSHINNYANATILKDPAEIKKNGNTVELNQQLSKISENQVNYNTSLQAYKSTIKLISTVLDKQ